MFRDIIGLLLCLTWLTRSQLITNCTKIDVNKTLPINLTTSGTNMSNGRIHSILKREISIACSAGSFFNSSAKSCQLCNTGTYQDKVGEADCLTCPKGYYQSKRGQITCQVCKGVAVFAQISNKILKIFLQSSPNQITNKHGTIRYPNLRHRHVSKVESDKYSRNKGYKFGTNDCIARRSGNRHMFMSGLIPSSHSSIKIFCYSEISTDILDIKAVLTDSYFPYIQECTVCPKLQAYNKTTNMCNLCPVGTYYDETTGQCHDCKPGTFSTISGVDKCTPCPIGSFRESNDSLTCDKCKANTYQNSTGGTSCYDCPDDSYQLLTGQAKCEPCGGKDGFAVSVRKRANHVTLFVKSFFKWPSYDKYDHKFKTFRNNSLSEEMIEVRDKGLDRNDCLLRGTSGWNLKLRAISSTDMIEICCFYGCFNTTPDSLQNMTFPYLDKCTICDADDEIYDHNSGNCTVCNPGHYLKRDEINFCVLCKKGEFQEEYNKESCNKCPRGMTTVNKSSANCSLCDPGYYQPTLGNRNCLQCPGLVVRTETIDDTLEFHLPSYYDGFSATHRDNIVDYDKLSRILRYEIDLDVFTPTNCIVKENNLTKFLSPLETTGIKKALICCYAGCETFPINVVNDIGFPFLNNCTVCSEVTISEMANNFTSNYTMDYNIELNIEMKRLEFATLENRTFDTIGYLFNNTTSYCGDCVLPNECESSTNTTQFILTTMSKVGISLKCKKQNHFSTFFFTLELSINFGIMSALIKTIV